MSINIQTSGGLVEIAGKVTKQQVISALEYTPADNKDLTNHEENNNIHVTTLDKDKWNNKSDFSGNYNDLDNAPNITEDNPNEFIITDSQGNKAFKVNEKGTFATNILLGNESNPIDVLDHVNNGNIHVSPIDRETWTNKPDSYQELLGAPSIEDDASSEFVIRDKTKYKIFSVDGTGAYATEVTLGSYDANGNPKTAPIAVREKLVELQTKVDNLDQASGGIIGDFSDLELKVNNHIDNSSDMHVSEIDRQTWGDYNNLQNKPINNEETDNRFIIQDPNGYKILQVDSAGITATDVITNYGKISDIVNDIDGQRTELNNYRNTFNAHTTATNPHGITLEGLGGVSSTNLEEINGSISELSITTQNLEIDISNIKDGSTIVEKANCDQNGLNIATNYATKTDLDAVEAELNEQLVSEIDELIVADSSKNVIARIDKDGITTTALNINEKDIGETFETLQEEVAEAIEKVNSHNHNTIGILQLSSSSTERPLAVISGVATDYNTTTAKQVPIYAHTNASYSSSLGAIIATCFVARSDKRLKENVKPFKTDKSILDLQVKEFDFINSDLHSIGLIAQELQELYPELVYTNDEGYLSIAESKLVYLLIDEIQKLRTRVEGLENEILKLKK